MILAYQVLVGIAQVGDQGSDLLHQLLLGLGLGHQSWKVGLGDVQTPASSSHEMAAK